MSLFAPSDDLSQATERKRRVLIVVDIGESVLAAALADYGYVTNTTTIASALWAIKAHEPDLVILELYQGSVGGNAQALYLARRLRTEPESYATPIVIAWSEEQETLHQAALYMGADDYFSLMTPLESILARLESLFWRVSAGRRTATLIGDQRLEIENFVLLTDSVRWDMERGWVGTLALAQPLARGSAGALDRAATESALTAICGFLKLQMRRMDSIVFYDASTLLIYLPHLPATIALGALTRLRGEFLEAQKSCDMALGLVSFPSDSTELETLLEMAETAALQARNNNEFRRVVPYGMNRAEGGAARLEAGVLADLANSEISVMSPVLAWEELPVTPHSPVAADVRAENLAAPAPSPAVAEMLPDWPVMPSLPETVTPLPGVGAVPLPPSPFPVLAEPVLTPEPPAFAADETARTEDVPLPEVSPVTGNRVASAQEIEQSLRPEGPCRLLLAVSRSERMAQLNTLVRSAGYEVRPAFDGPHALGLLRIDPPDLMLLDYEVSGLNGLETLHRVQTQYGGRLPVPVILLGPAEIKAEAEALGVRRVITLPYSPIELLAAMRQAASAS